MAAVQVVRNLTADQARAWWASPMRRSISASLARTSRRLVASTPMRPARPVRGISTAQRKPAPNALNITAVLAGMSARILVSGIPIDPRFARSNGRAPEIHGGNSQSEEVLSVPGSEN